MIHIKTKRNRHRKSTMTEEEKKAHKKEYQHQYYQTHKEKALNYQRDYTAKNKSAHKWKVGQRESQAIKLQEEREARRSVYHHSDLMHRPTESFEKAVGRILRGDADFTGVK